MDGSLRAEQLARRRLSSMNSLCRSSWSLPETVGNRPTTLTHTKMGQKPHKPVLSPPRKKQENEAETSRIDMDRHGSTWGRRGSMPVLSPPSYVHPSTVPNTVAVPPWNASGRGTFTATCPPQYSALKTKADPPAPMGGRWIFSLGTQHQQKFHDFDANHHLLTHLPSEKLTV